MDAERPPTTSTSTVHHGALPHAPLLSAMASAYRRATGTNLWGVVDLHDPLDRLLWLHERAPFGLLMHDAKADPHFVYANWAAASWFRYEPDELIGLPSRLSADEANQDDRNRLLAEVEAKGFTTGYRGVRVDRLGRRFWIQDVTMWNVVDQAGHNLGQAALLGRYRRG